MSSWPPTTPAAGSSADTQHGDSGPSDGEHGDSGVGEATVAPGERDDADAGRETERPVLPTMAELDRLSAELDDVDAVLARMDDPQGDGAND